MEGNLFPQEGRGRSEELGPAGTDDRAVARIGNDPEARVPNGFSPFDKEFDGDKEDRHRPG